MSTKWERTDRRVLDVANGLLAERHDHEITMEEVAAEVGISRQALYNHFPSKNHLMAAVLNDLQTTNDVAAGWTALIDHDHPHRALRAAARHAATQHHNLYAAGRTLLTHRRHDDAAAAAHDAKRGHRRAGHLALAEKLHAEGSLRQGLDPDTAADLMEMLHSMEVYEMLVIDGGWELDAYEEQLFEATKRAVLTSDLH